MMQYPFILPGNEIDEKTAFRGPEPEEIERRAGDRKKVILFASPLP